MKGHGAFSWKLANEERISFHRVGANFVIVREYRRPGLAAIWAKEDPFHSLSGVKDHLILLLID